MKPRNELYCGAFNLGGYMKEKRKFSYIIKYYDNMSNTVSIVLYDINKKKALQQFRRYYGGYTIISIEGE